MIKPPSTQDSKELFRFYAAFERLSAHEDYKFCIEHLTEELNRLDVLCRKKEGPALFRAQGAAQTIDAFLTLLKDAAKNKEEHRSNTN